MGCDGPAGELANEDVRLAALDCRRLGEDLAGEEGEGDEGDGGAAVASKNSCAAQSSKSGHLTSLSDATRWRPISRLRTPL